MKDDFTKKLNRYFHDEESSFFSKRHDVRVERESRFYSGIFTAILSEKQGFPRILDIGTGMGLVPRSLHEVNCRFTCADISSEMLKSARVGLEGAKSFQINFVACDAEKLPFRSETFDIVTCNAAMHHLPGIDLFAAEVYRILAPEGTAIIGFETNRRFWMTKPLSVMYRALTKLMPPLAGSGVDYSAVCKRVNERLLAEGVIKEPLEINRMLQCVDVHSPNAGNRIDYSKGFDVMELSKSIFVGYDCKVFYHYDGLPVFLREVNRIFFPAAAPQFSLILRKRSN